MLKDSWVVPCEHSMAARVEDRDVGFLILQTALPQAPPLVVVYCIMTVVPSCSLRLEGNYRLFPVWVWSPPCQGEATPISRSLLDGLREDRLMGSPRLGHELKYQRSSFLLSTSLLHCIVCEAGSDPPSLNMMLWQCSLQVINESRM